MTKQSKKKKRDSATVLRVAGLIFFVVFLIGGLVIQDRGQVSRFPVTTARNCQDAAARYVDQTVPVEERISDLIARMTIEEKIGQMALIEKNNLHDPQDISTYHLGVLLSGGGSKPKDNTPEGWRAMIREFDTIARSDCLRVPLLFGVDANHGHGNIPGATIFPHSIGLGATKDADLVTRVAQATREELLATGVRWSFSPDTDIARDMRWGRVYETFGSDVETVSTLGRAYVEGLQNPFGSVSMIAGTAKHFLGSGAATWGTSVNKEYFLDQGVTNISETELRRTHLPPFQEAVKAGVMSVMAGLNRWQGAVIAANRYLLTDVLKNELGFRGFVVSDWYGVYEIAPSKYESTVTAINAGVDMVMLPFDYEIFTRDMREAIRNGDITEARLDDAVRRILRAKFSLGLFDEAELKVDASTFGSTAHRELAREAVRKSLVELKNIGQTLPLRKDFSRIIVAGSAADNLGQQMGAWTVEWQGIDGNWIPGTTILAGVKRTVSPETIVEYRREGNFLSTKTLADVGIAVVGEKPYAEGVGDEAHPRLSDEDLATIKRVRAASKKLVVIIVSGRPLDLSAVSTRWDAVVAAWLPGSEGAGVADVLFGDYEFVGKLPVEWSVK
ncbi:MAG: glycoside hydrolase family 3 N-terminal domain-containing protein [Patescibacteria group bacterium]|jgi:beta-glucosidase